MREDGLTDPEGEVMDALMDAASGYAELPVQHPDEITDFFHAIHEAQGILACRIARRHYPEGWPTYAD